MATVHPKLFNNNGEEEMKIGKSGTVFLLSVVLLLLFVVPVMAEQEKTDQMNVSQAFNIELGSLEDSLDAYSKTTGIKTVYLNELVAEKKSQGLQGVHSTEAALRNILQGTGLTYQVAANETIVLKKNEDTTPQEEKEKKSTVKQSRNELKLEDLKVTAQKQEENVQEVPISITVFNEMDIEDRMLESLTDLADFVPNLTLFQHGHPFITSPTIRGIYAPATSLLTSTGLFIDGIPILMAVGFEDELLGIERVEVLRGPQGTIYGAGTEAGAINLVTRQPNNDFRGKISTQLGEDSKEQLSLNISGPILKHKLFFGLAGNYYQKDGFMEHSVTGETLDDRKYWTTRAQLRWTPSDKLDTSLIVSFRKEDSGMGHMSLGALGAARAEIPEPKDRRVNINKEASYAKPETSLQALKIAYNISNSLTLTSISTNWLYKDYMAKDFDGTPKTIKHVKKRDKHGKISQELRLNYSTDQMKGLAGLYYDKIDNKMNFDFSSMIPKMRGKIRREFGGNTYAAFVNTTYPFLDKFSLITGARYEIEDQNFEDKNRHITRDESWESFTPKIALEYRPTTRIMTYVNVSKGYRSGGFNWAALEPEYVSFDQEKLWSYEVGAKSIFFNNRLIINGAVYYMNITDMQVTEGITPLVNYTTNAAEATSKGFELELTGRIADGLTVNASYGYNNIEFDKFSDVMGDYKGNSAPFSPEYTFNIGGQYRHNSGFYVRADLMGYGQMYFSKQNQYGRDAYEIVNAKIGYETETFDAYLYGKNVFDKEYNSEGYFGGFWNIYSDPREIGLQLVYRF